jgi:hypothetical protein
MIAVKGGLAFGSNEKENRDIGVSSREIELVLNPCFQNPLRYGCMCAAVDCMMSVTKKKELTDQTDKSHMLLEIRVRALPHADTHTGIYAQKVPRI